MLTHKFLTPSTRDFYMRISELINTDIYKTSVSLVTDDVTRPNQPMNKRANMAKSMIQRILKVFL